MAGAYATLAADGMHFPPYFVEEVLDTDGNVIFAGTTPGERVLTESSARQVTDVLHGVVEAGTGTRAELPGGRPAAGKTGTTSDYSDAWFAGYVPRLATAVWMGSPEGNVPMRNVNGARVTGGSYPARMWRAFMGPAMEGQPIVPFPPAPAVGRVEPLHPASEPPPTTTTTPPPTTTEPPPPTTEPPPPTTEPPPPTTEPPPPTTEPPPPTTEPPPPTTEPPPPTTEPPPPTTEPPPPTTEPPPTTTTQPPPPTTTQPPTTTTTQPPTTTTTQPPTTTTDAPPTGAGDGDSLT
jgi:membrane peptidoglycan carboxypeptidase